MRRLLDYVRPYRAKYVVLFVLVTLSAGVSAAGPYIQKLLIDKGFTPRSLSAVEMFVALWLVDQAAVLVLDWLKSVRFSRLGQGVVRDIRHDMFEHLTRKDVRFYTRNSLGDLLARIDGDAGNLESILTSDVLTVISDLMTVVSVSVFLVVVDWRLFGLAAILVPVVYLLQRSFTAPITAGVQELREAVSDSFRYVTESLGHMQTFQNHGREPWLIDGFGVRSERVRSGRIRVTAVGASSAALFGAVGTVAAAIILGYGGAQIVGGKLSIGDVMAFLSYFFMVLGPIEGLANVKLNMTTARVAWSRVAELLDDRDEVESTGDRKPALDPPMIEFTDVFFAYGDGPAVLEGTSWRVEPGQTVLLQGPSGAGKTTTTRLILKQVQPCRGTIDLDGVDLSDVDTGWLRRHVFMLEQDPLVVTGTLRDNITLFSDCEVSDAELDKAVWCACLEQFVAKLPMGLDTEIGERGINVSGGQRQRIALARSVIADRPLLVMDECTSAIDTETEETIFERLAQTLRRRTTILVSHRPPKHVVPDVVVRLRARGSDTVAGAVEGIA